MKDLVARLSSRKFWLTIAAFATFVAQKEYGAALGVVLGFLGVEGAADVVHRDKRK